jgi:hypothetical protein
VLPIAAAGRALHSDPSIGRDETLARARTEGAVCGLSTRWSGEELVLILGGTPGISAVSRSRK